MSLPLPGEGTGLDARLNNRLGDRFDARFETRNYIYHTRREGNHVVDRRCFHRFSHFLRVQYLY